MIPFILILVYALPKSGKLGELDLKTNFPHECKIVVHPIIAFIPGISGK